MNRRTFALVVVLMLFAAACGGDQAAEQPVAEADAAEEAEPAVAEAPGRADADLVVWADDVRARVMENIGAQFTAEHGVTIAVQEVAGEDLRGQLQTAGPVGEGPDLIIGAHDWIGELVTNGAIAPIALPNPEDFVDVAIEAFTWEGQLYGMPFAIENLALYRNTDHVPEAPGTWEELESTALRLQDEGEVRQGLVVPVAPEESPYHMQPMFTALGGYVFGQEDDGTYDTSDVGIDSEGGLRAAAEFRRWAQEGLINPDITGQIMQDQFGNGDAAFAISGPWSLVQDGRGFQETGVPFEVSPIPPIDGGTPRPFVGAQGVMVSAFSENALLAQTFAVDYMSGVEAQLQMFEANTRPPALRTAYEEVTQDPVFEAFGEAGQEGQPMPAVPAMSTVFTAMGDAYTLVLRGDADPENAFTAAAEQVRGAVEG